MEELRSLIRAIRTDIGIVLEYWIMKNHNDLSFHSFQYIWKGNNDNDDKNLPSLCNLIHCFPGIKNDYIDQKNEKMIHFSQIIFLSLFLMLFQPNDNTKRYINQKIDAIDITNEITLEEKDIISQCIWNIGVIYTISSLYHTQPINVKNTNPLNQKKLPIRVNIETYAQLLLAVERISFLSKNISAQDAVLLVDKMERDNAFCIGIFTGFRVQANNITDTNKIDLNGIASANQICKSERFVNIASYFMDSMNSMSVKILRNVDADLVEQQQRHHVDVLDDVQQRRKAYKDSRKPKQSNAASSKRDKEITVKENTKKGIAVEAAKITLTIDDSHGNCAFTPLTSSRYHETRTSSLSTKKRKLLTMTPTDEDIPPSWTDSQATFETSDFDQFFGETSQLSVQKMDTNRSTQSNPTATSLEISKSNKPQEKRKKKVKNDIELLTMMINSQT